MQKSKNGKNWVFLPPEGDKINRSRQNLAPKRTPWVCYSTPNLALIGKRGLVQESPKVPKFAQNCGFGPPEAETMNTFRWIFFWVSVDLGSAIAHQIWPSLVKGGRYRSPQKCQNSSFSFLTGQVSLPCSILAVQYLIIIKILYVCVVPCLLHSNSTETRFIAMFLFDLLILFICSPCINRVARK